MFDASVVSQPVSDCCLVHVFFAQRIAKSAGIAKIAEIESPFQISFISADQW
jgi:hypothetical protein